MASFPHYAADLTCPLYQILIPMMPELDPVAMLTDDATVALWNNEGLPGDKMSTQNATILTNCQWHHAEASAGRVFTGIMSILFICR